MIHYLYFIINKQTKEIMTTQEINIANALITAKEVLTQMIAQGFGEAKEVFAVSNMIQDRFNLTQDQSIVVIEEALKIA
jgi:hypothetical protein